MVMREIPDGLDTGTPCSSKTLNDVMTGHEPVAHGRHPMFTSDPVVIEHAGLCDVSRCNEEIVATALDQGALEPRYEFEDEGDVSTIDYKSVRRRN